MKDNYYANVEENEVMEVIKEDTELKKERKKVLVNAEHCC